MNHIQNIEIKNFKSIRHQTIEDCRRVNVFIGYPNVGKSNILEAISLFSVNEDVNLKDLIRVKEETTIFFDGFINNTIEVVANKFYKIEAKYLKTEFIIKYEYIEEKSPNAIRILNRDGTTIFKYPVLREIFYRNFLYNRKSAHNPLTIQIKSWQIKKYDFRKYNEQSTNGEIENLNFPFGSNLFNVISSNESIQKEISTLFESYNLEILYDTRIGAYSILKRTGKGIFTIPYELIADTLQRLIFYKTAILSNKKSILLFEEPEAHMFPPYISKLTSDIVNDENNNQFFLATHSPFVMNDLISNVEKDELAIYIVSYENKTGETLIHRMSEEDVNEAYQFGYDFFMNINNFIPQKEHGQV